MTIKELEERTGMPRANIRFYEDEGLLKPTRLPNGYRDYSEDDILTLEKIKLLRQLHLDINTIRLVQEGKLSLEKAMFSQLNRLEGDKAVIERAVEVCRGIERSGVEYGALEPKAWLKELEAPSRPNLPPPEPKPQPTEQDIHYQTHRAYDHPWMRWFARSIDVGLCKLFFLALFLLVFRWYGYMELGWLAETLINIGIYCVSILVEPLWLHYVGWTPGKWIFGLKLRDKHGDKLSLSQARSRAWQVAWQGDGLSIPFYCLWRNWKSYKCCRDEGDCPWDADGEYRYTREERRLYGLWWAGEVAVHIILIVLLGLYILLPLNRGPMTVAEFCENYNEVIEKNQIDMTKLDQDGKWMVRTPIGGGHTVIIDPYEGDTVWLDPEFTVENGCVTAVTFRMESDRERLSLDDSRPLLGMMALSGSAEHPDLFRYRYNDWVNAWEEHDSEYWQDFEFTYRGLRVTQTVEAYGYKGSGPTHYDDYLIAIEDQEHFVTRTVTISIVGSEN